jgi:hypothetical protein
MGAAAGLQQTRHKGTGQCILGVLLGPRQGDDGRAAPFLHNMPQDVTAYLMSM